VTRLKPRTATVVLYQGDDMATLSELKRAADHAMANGTRTDDGADEKIAYDAFVDKAAERAVEVVIQSIGPRRWQDLVLAHPPRMVESEPDDEGRTRMVEHDDDLDGVDTSTFPRALLTYVDPEKPHFRTIIGPEFADEADLAEFVDDEIAQGDFERLWQLAFQLNTARGRDPKDHTFGQRSDESTT
jgi:hypothetical protein